jgi:signal peptidase I
MRRAPRWLLLLIIPILLGLPLFAFDLPRTSSDDMAPSLRKGDLLLACRLCGGPERGDVVVFTHPEEPGQLSIRRIVGAPGDRVEVQKGQVKVNGVPLVDEPQGKIKLPGFDDGADVHEFEAVNETVGAHQFQTLRDVGLHPRGERAAHMLEDEYFLLADRRTQARDSRDYGPVRARDVRSTVLRVLHAGDGDGTRQKSVP